MKKAALLMLSAVMACSMPLAAFAEAEESGAVRLEEEIVSETAEIAEEETESPSEEEAADDVKETGDAAESPEESEEASLISTAEEALFQEPVSEADCESVPETEGLVSGEAEDKVLTLTGEDLANGSLGAFTEALTQEASEAIAEEAEDAAAADHAEAAVEETAEEILALYDSITGKTAEDKVYNFLINELGCNVATACGILANCKQESSFDPMCKYTEKDGAVSFGLFQWNKTRRSNMESYVKSLGLDVNTVEAQLIWLKYELEHGEKSAWSRMQGFPNTAQGAYDAAYTWARYYERCSSASYSTRAMMAKETFWPYYSGRVTCSCNTQFAGYCTATGSTTIRMGHSTDYGSLGTLPKGAKAYVSLANGEWAHVSYNGINGYCSMKYLKKTSTATIPSGGGVHYRTYVQTYGWLEYVSNGVLSGTVGEGKRMEGIQIQVSGMGSGSIKYRTYCQDYGWLDWSSNGTFNGTRGESKRLECIQIKLTGTLAENYDIYYRVQVQSYGWLGWAKNGEKAGTQGYKFRMEAIQIKLVPKGSTAPGKTIDSYHNKYEN